MGKSNKIRHIVRLRQMLRRWRMRARGSAAAATPADVPAGHVAVCVGSSNRRFVVKAAHLNHPAFQKLLLQAEEEYGFSCHGPLSLPCDESLFVQILRQISSSYAFLLSAVDDFDASAASVTASCCCYLAGGRNPWRGDTLPLLSDYAEKRLW
ncbi:Indole-3-acetic acid-induced protein ARG7 [Apostasia shenzhenica]|uniref:Indole-3-acetic acid-induced protein ARG7 n=1 Tax=Apostasia shenzhenica TaxID=1088818 RepID=A0A2H9ZZT2_9ASPA|nr:Indole-3-acetic acid-induced protein ARG7 [Apostasia shenzhenica]